MDIDSSYQLVNGGIENVNYTVSKMVVMIFDKKYRTQIIWNLQQLHAIDQFARKPMKRRRYGIESTRSTHTWEPFRVYPHSV